MNNLIETGSSAPLSLPLLALGMLGLLLLVFGTAALLGTVIWIVRTRPHWRRLAADIRLRPWTGPDAAVVLLVLASLHLVLFLCIDLRRYLDPTAEAVVLFLSVVTQTLMFQGGTFIAVRRMMRARELSWESAFGVRSDRFVRDVLLGLLFYLAAMPLVIASAWLYRSVLLHFRIDVQPQAVIEIFLSTRYPAWLKAYLGLVAITVAPFVEEMLFRGIGLPFLVKHARPAIGVLAVSVVFSAVHFNLPSLVPLFVIACAFSGAYILTGSLIVPIVMHTAFNAMTLVAIALVKVMPAIQG